MAKSIYILSNDLYSAIPKSISLDIEWNEIYTAVKFDITAEDITISISCWFYNTVVRCWSTFSPKWLNEKTVQPIFFLFRFFIIRLSLPSVDWSSNWSWLIAFKKHKILEYLSIL